MLDDTKGIYPVKISHPAIPKGSTLGELRGTCIDLRRIVCS